MSNAFDDLADFPPTAARVIAEVLAVVAFSARPRVARLLRISMARAQSEDGKEDRAMKRLLSGAVVALGVLVLAGEGAAQMPGPMHGRMGGAAGGGMGGAMGPPTAGQGTMMMRHGMMGGQPGEWNCPMAGMTAAAEATVVTEQKAKELAQGYADQYLKGFTVERVLPFTGMRGTMYSVELAGPDGQVRTLHVNPWGAVMPFGGPGRRAG
jgi:hypothetical protein